MAASRRAPPSLPDFLKRDLRWCQGNMQYVRLLGLPGVRPLGRLQLLLAILMYAAAPAWLAFVLLGITQAVLPALGTASGGAAGAFWTKDVFAVGVGLFATMLTMSFAPKLAGVAQTLLSPELAGPMAARRGSSARPPSSFFSLLISPVMAVMQSLFIAGMVLFGRTVVWGAQSRSLREVGLVEASRGLWVPTLLGGLLTGVAWLVVPAALPWLVPMVTGLVLAAPVAWITSSPTLGHWLADLGVCAPEEADPPPECGWRAMPARGRSPGRRPREVPPRRRCGRSPQPAAEGGAPEAPCPGRRASPIAAGHRRHHCPREPRMPLLRRLALAAACALAAAATAAGAEPPAAPKPTAVLESGETIIGDGLSGDGSRLATMARAPDGCWRLRLYDLGTGQPRPIADLLARNSDAVGCVPTVATMSSDGSTILIHAYGSARGRIYRVGSDGIESAGEPVLEGSKGYDHPAPPAVALSPDGRTAVIGALNYDCRVGVPADRCGTAQLFQEQGTGWKLRGVFKEPDPAIYNVAFGGAVGVTDGAAVVVTGGHGLTGDPGQLLVFTDQPEGWALASTLEPATASEGTFGETLALTPDARVLAIGSDQSVYVVVKAGSDWKRAARIEPPEAEAGGFGEAVALSSRRPPAPDRRTSRGVRDDVAPLRDRLSLCGLG